MVSAHAARTFSSRYALQDDRLSQECIGRLQHAQAYVVLEPATAMIRRFRPGAVASALVGLLIHCRWVLLNGASVPYRLWTVLGTSPSSDRPADAVQVRILSRGTARRPPPSALRSHDPDPFTRIRR